MDEPRQFSIESAVLVIQENVDNLEKSLAHLRERIGPVCGETFANEGKPVGTAPDKGASPMWCALNKLSARITDLTDSLNTTIRRIQL